MRRLQAFGKRVTAETQTAEIHIIQMNRFSVPGTAVIVRAN